MTRTGLSKRLGAHLPEPFVEIHPDDANKYSIVHDGFARITTDYGQCILTVVVSERQQRGMLFAPIHWSAMNASHGRVGALAAPFTDPFSGQPESKATPAAIAPYEYVFRGFALSRKQLDLPPNLLWTRATVTGGFGYLFADNADLARWPAWLDGVAGEDVAEYRDFGGGVYRAASFAGDRIETCLFVGPAHDAGDWEVVKSVFAADHVTDEQRRMLLSGKSSEGAASTGPIVCACFGVGRATICDDHRSRRPYDRRDRRQAQGRHQLRLLHPRTEAADCDDRGGAGEAAEDRRCCELSLILPRLRPTLKLRRPNTCSPGEALA